MDTTVTIEVAALAEEAAILAAIDRAFGWFAEVERRCSRFDPTSELSLLSNTREQPVPVSPLLFHVLDLALAIAETSGGAFDPTVGAAMEARGFDRNFRTGEHHRSAAKAIAASYRDVILDAASTSVTLQKPLVLDLGAIAKGFAMDLAGRELAAFENSAINAGGDILVRGHNAAGQPWSIGVRHPREPGALLRTITVRDAAVCTSGDYERPADAGGHHILDPGTGRSPDDVVSATVIAPAAAVADGLATAAFVLGAQAGLDLLFREGVDGLIVTRSLAEFATPGFAALA